MSNSDGTTIRNGANLVRQRRAWFMSASPPSLLKWVSWQTCRARACSGDPENFSRLVETAHTDSDPQGWASCRMSLKASADARPFYSARGFPSRHVRIPKAVGSEGYGFGETVSCGCSRVRTRIRRGLGR